ncbi:putative dynein light chain roadblock-type 2 [Toxoplasma gondii MAS]|uniref:Putative dynein light chain roadblock-type 2 n=1 Tax=Toxoplasma gondii MAS TaxID=943118 RepID=A0A086Q578_TOXGO|nr:putative dynein light chain roadblock-type 2 [Toxoplasma gondii MAS]
MSEVEETLNRIKTHKGVCGIVIVNSDGVPIRSTLDSQTTAQYSALISQLAAKARSVVRDLDPQTRLPFFPVFRFDCIFSCGFGLLQNDLTFLRIRSKKHEILVAPDKDYVLIVIQDPNSEQGTAN